MLSIIITARCYAECGRPIPKSSVGLENVGGLWSHRLEFFESNVSKHGVFALHRPQHHESTPKGTSKILAGIGVGYGKNGFPSVNKSSIISLKRVKIGPRLRYYWGPIGSHLRTSGWCQNQFNFAWLWRVIIHSVWNLFQTCRIFRYLIMVSYWHDPTASKHKQIVQIAKRAQCESIPMRC